MSARIHGLAVVHCSPLRAASAPDKHSSSPVCGTCQRLTSMQDAQQTAQPSSREREQRASLRRLTATYDAKCSALQEHIDQLTTTIAVGQSKVAEAKHELARASPDKSGSVKAQMAHKQLEDRTAVMQQRLNATLAQNAQLHSEIEERRQKVQPLILQCCLC